MNICSNCGLKSNDTKTIELPRTATSLPDRVLIICTDRPACRLRELAKIKEEAKRIDPHGYWR